MPSLGPNLRGALLALAAFAIYASHDAAIKVVGGRITSVQIVFFSVVLGVPLAAFVVWRRPEGARLWPVNPGWMALRSGGVVLSAVAGFYAFSVLPLAQVYAILFAAPLLITLMSVPVLGESVGPRRLIAVVVGLIGVMVVLRPGAASLGPGHLAALAATTGSALSQIVVRRIADTESSAALLIWPMIANAVLMGTVLPFVYVPMTGTELMLMIYVAACAFAAMMLLILAYRLGEAVVVAPMQYSQILWAVLFGALFFDEFPDLFTGVGAGIVIASGLFIVLRESRTRATALLPDPPGSQPNPLPAPGAAPAAPPAAAQEAAAPDDAGREDAGREDAGR